MFFLYSLWGLCYIFLNFSHETLEKYFFVKNNPFLIRKRTFKYISYFEKLFLVLFYKKGWFEDSIANVYRKKDIIDYRKNFYPNIYSFHINYNTVNYEINSLKFLVDQYKYYFKKSIVKKKLSKIIKLCFVNKNFFIKYLMFQSLYIKKYYNFNSYFNFYNKSNLNLIKLNKVFYTSLLKCNKKLILFNLDKWNDWYNFNFGSDFISYCNLNIKLDRQQQIKALEFKKNKISKWINIVFKYKKRVYNFNNFFKKKFNGIIFFKYNLNNGFNIKINKDYFFLLKYYIIKFSESSITKHINSGSLKKYSVQYLRKNRIFNKGRYSRNRQLYRTGVYWCLWLNIIIVYGLYFIFYRFTFNFGYFWWGILILAYSTIFSRISKYNFYNINYLFKEFNSLIKWYGSIFNNMLNYFEILLKYYFYDINLFNYLAKYKNNNLSFFYDSYYYYFSKFFQNFIKNRKKIKITFMWKGMKEKDNSFLRYKTIIHWLKEIYRLIVTV